MINKPTLLKERMHIARALLLFSAPLLVFIAPHWEDYSLLHESMETIGHLLVFSGVLIRVYTSLYSGGQKNKKLLVDGPYSIVRNPLYVGSLFAVLGLGLQTGSLVIAAIAVFVFLMLHQLTVLKEEAFLGEQYGDAYRNYYRSVPRWIPNLTLWKQMHELVVKPRMVLLTIRDASGFVLALVIIELLCALRASAALPAWITLP